MSKMISNHKLNQINTKENDKQANKL